MARDKFEEQNEILEVKFINSNRDFVVDDYKIFFENDIYDIECLSSFLRQTTAPVAVYQTQIGQNKCCNVVRLALHKTIK